MPLHPLRCINNTIITRFANNPIQTSNFPNPLNLLAIPYRTLGQSYSENLQISKSISLRY